MMQLTSNVRVEMTADLWRETMLALRDRMTEIQTQAFNTRDATILEICNRQLARVNNAGNEIGRILGEGF